MTGFLDNLLKTSLEFPRDGDLKIERAHRALAPKPTDPKSRPHSIVVKFGSWRTKEEVIKRAWQKKVVFYDNVCFYVDHDFPSEVLKKRNEYAKAKRVLKEKQIRFQTPCPAKMRIFYEGCSRTPWRLQGTWRPEGFQLRWRRNLLHRTKRISSSYQHGR